MDDLKSLKEALEAKEDKDVAEVGDSERNPSKATPNPVPAFQPPSPQLVKRVKPAQLSSLLLDAKALLAQGLPQAAIAYLERYI